MTGTNEKTRFYLEQSVPELQTAFRKGVFSQVEIASITKKRSSFEHKLNARGSSPQDYALYAQYETNLEALRQRRIRRLRVKDNGHTGTRRIFFILDRATRKFPADVALWMQYLSFARKQRSNKKLSQILTDVLRLHPTKAELWIFAANFALDERGDMAEARSYMQRGLRFCKQSEELWTEYVRLELGYIAKLIHRMQRLDMMKEKPSSSLSNADGELDADHLMLASVDDSTIVSNLAPVDLVSPDALKSLARTPVLSGAIPVTLFDAAMKESRDNLTLGQKIFNVIYDSEDIPCLSTISEHIVQRLRQIAPASATFLNCYICQPTIGLKPNSGGFPRALSESLNRLNVVVKTDPPPIALAEASRARGVLLNGIMHWLLDLLRFEGLDEDLREVLEATLRKTGKLHEIYRQQSSEKNVPEFTRLLERMKSYGLDDLAV